MKTIKIRAWHKSLKLMYWFNVEWGNMCSVGSGYIGMLPLYKIERKSKSFSQPEDRIPIDPNDCELLLSTGLFDKNDNEIFEGHIIISGNGKICKISFGEFVWRYEPDDYGQMNVESSIGFYFDFPNAKYFEPFGSSALGGGKSYEIIGNIYENPELIK